MRVVLAMITFIYCSKGEGEIYISLAAQTAFFLSCCKKGSGQVNSMVNRFPIHVSRWCMSDIHLAEGQVSMGSLSVQ